MKKIDTYIIEKLKINKDTKISDKEDASEMVVDVIHNYLNELRHYLNTPLSNFDIDSRENQVILRISPDIERSDVNKIGKDIMKQILKLKLDWYWSYDEMNHKIIFSDSIV